MVPWLTAVSICDQVRLEPGGVLQAGFDLISPTWPNVAQLRTVRLFIPYHNIARGDTNRIQRHKKNKHYDRFYDTDDPSKPLEPGWFKLIRRGDPWPNDVPGKANQNRCYNVEHILEWQLLIKFIEENKEATDSRCVFMHKYFVGASQAMKLKFKVKVAKDYGKLNTNNQFDYEDKEYDFTKWSVRLAGQNVEPRPIDYVGK